MQAFAACCLGKALKTDRQQRIADIDRRFGLPIYVLENGTAADDEMDREGQVQDTGRIAYLQAYIDAMGEAIAAGADIRGYFVWSLLDNFEWALGYRPRFGIVSVDRDTLARTPKPSAKWFAAVAAANALDA